MSEAAVRRAHAPSRSPAPARPSINLLSYVHLRNIHASTGAGRVARQLTEHLALREDVNLRILADAADHAKIVPLAGAPWDRFDYCFFASETSRQQARWFAFDRPRAESYWPEAQVVFCTGAQSRSLPHRLAFFGGAARPFLPRHPASSPRGAERRLAAFLRARC
jgi:hypothetical protein